MELRRLTRGEVARILAAAGVLDLSPDSDFDAKVRAVTMAARLVSGSYTNDVALVYAAVVNHFEDLGLEPLWITEDLFFDTITREVASGQIAKEERAQLGAPDRPVAEEARHRERQEEPWRDRGTGPGGRRGRAVEVAAPRPGSYGGVEAVSGAGEASQGAVSVEGDERGEDWNDIPF